MIGQYTATLHAYAVHEFSMRYVCFFVSSKFAVCIRVVIPHCRAHQFVMKKGSNKRLEVGIAC